MYTLDISGHHVHTTEEVQQTIKEGMDQLADINSNITSIKVIVNSESHQNKSELIIEARVHIPGHDLFASVTTDKQLSAAVDALVEKLEKQLLKHKAKHEGRKHHPDARDVETNEEREEQEEFNELERRDVV
ncbi:ribosome hibernation promoting factor HPF [Marinomonas gallaica]|uniref:Ribosome hibernation promoting factor HPF n=1 Tax=Marinomonas gallaica TaxID=1806667 RepID=A0A1C3JUI9_9GAMM|nr:ribosome-associated translation inhibitor RaiA [Marinomonas gallaica]SBT18873.1 ribosome hibernation promoting factor HPF [Marinomonas gallaica]SBT21828.1 ribosome hibernation promoting factor HPF [Marinomonas gallaica]